jgi:hypothetical protein
MRRINVSHVILSIFLLVGCSTPKQVVQQSAEPTVIQNKSSDVGSMYPAGKANPVGNDPYPALNMAEVLDRSKPEPPIDALPPEKGKASISGGLFSYTSGIQVAQTQFYLTRLEEGDANNIPPFFTGPNLKTEDVLYTTDEKGNFRIYNVPPGTYLLVVWAPYNWVLAQKTREDVSPLVLVLEADKRYPMGTINIAWP